MFTKEICYDRETRDYAMYLDGELVGFARTYHEAEITLDQLVYELLQSGITRTATELDSGAVEEITADMPEGDYIGERCSNCGSTHMVALAGKILCLVCGRPWRPMRCSSCNDVLTAAGPLCPDCQGSGEHCVNEPRLTCPQLVALAVNGPDEPAPGPHGDEEDTNHGGWRAPVSAAGWGVEAWEQ